VSAIRARLPTPGIPARRIVGFFAALLLAGLAGCALAPASPNEREVSRRQVLATEAAFARTMADRDVDAFAAFLSDEAVFVGGATPLRGKAEVVAAWKRYFEGPAAPFAWAPERVEVLPSGTLALSSGPVRAPDGTVVASFTSIWRLEAPGVWRIVFDQGCDCPPPGPAPRSASP
jgi:ketosteroid isomerase-like protein